MNPQIYYFTGTGNSLFIARQIAENIDGKLISIASVVKREHITTDAQIIGLVFPVYYASNLSSGIPLIVERFLYKLEGLGSKYIFAVCTHSGMPGTTLEKVSKICKSRGGELAGGFTVLTYNDAPTLGEKLKKIILRNESKTHKKVKIQKRHAKILELWNEKLSYISNYIANKEKGELETRKKITNLVFVPILYLLIKPVFKKRYQKLSNASHLPFKEMIRLADRSFYVEENCSGCGICVRICPVNNIKLINGKPVWQNHCENCFACFAWCPNESINGAIVSYAEHYHHSTVKVTDMIDQVKKFREVEN
jgi:ferredoxin